MTPRPRPLTSRQERFIAEYLKDYNGAGAARRAGYKKWSARHSSASLLKRPEVQAIIEARRARVAAGAELTRERIIAGLLECIDRRETPVRAWELLGREIKMFRETTEVLVGKLTEAEMLAQLPAAHATVAAYLAENAEKQGDCAVAQPEERAAVNREDVGSNPTRTE